MRRFWADSGSPFHLAKNSVEIRPLTQYHFVFIFQNSFNGHVSSETEEAEVPISPTSTAAPTAVFGSRRRKKRTTIEGRLRVTLENYFRRTPKPTADQICAIADGLRMDREVCFIIKQKYFYIK